MDYACAITREQILRTDTPLRSFFARAKFVIVAPNIPRQMAEDGLKQATGRREDQAIAMYMNATWVVNWEGEYPRKLQEDIGEQHLPKGPDGSPVLRPNFPGNRAIAKTFEAAHAYSKAIAKRMGEFGYTHLYADESVARLPEWMRRKLVTLYGDGSTVAMGLEHNESWVLYLLAAIREHCVPLGIDVVTMCNTANTMPPIPRARQSIEIANAQEGGTQPAKALATFQKQNEFFPAGDIPNIAWSSSMAIPGLVMPGMWFD